MSLTLHLFKNNKDTGTIIITNTSPITITNWSLDLIPENFRVIHFDNINYERINNKIRITPKEWKINLESNTQIVSNFTYESILNNNSEKLNYTLTNIIYEPLKNIDEKPKGIIITIENNTRDEIIIKPGGSYKFTV